METMQIRAGKGDVDRIRGMPGESDPEKIHNLLEGVDRDTVAMSHAAAKDTGATQTEGEDDDLPTKLDNLKNKVLTVQKLKDENQFHDTMKFLHDIEGLIRAGIEIRKWILLSHVDVVVEGDPADEDKGKIKEISEWFHEEILWKLREAYPRYERYGEAFLQKIRPKEVDKNGIGSLRLLTNHGTSIHRNPLDPNDYYFYQKVIILDNWKDPSDKSTKEHVHWWLPDGKSKDHATAAGDKIGDIKDILYMERSGGSILSDKIDAIIDKAEIYRRFPVLVKRAVVDPVIGFLGQNNKDMKTVPVKPTTQLQTADQAKYAELNAKYQAYTTAQQSLANDLANLDENDAIVVGSKDDYTFDTIQYNKQGSAVLIREIVRLLNEEIARGIIPLALLEARGTELATSRAIKELISDALRGEHADFEEYLEDLKREHFGDGYEKYKPKLVELNPKNKKEAAELEEIISRALVNYRTIGMKDDSIVARAKSLGIETDITLGEAPMAEGMFAERYSKEELESFALVSAKIVENRQKTKEDLLAR